MKKGLKNEKAGTWLYQIAQGNKKNPTEAEKRIIDFLEKYSIDYEFQKPVRCTNGKGYILDFELTYAYKGDKHYHYLHQPIEVDGGYHNEETQRYKDSVRDQELLERSHYKKVIHIPNELTENEEDIIAFLQQELPTNRAGLELRKLLTSQKKTNAGLTCFPTWTRKEEAEYWRNRYLELKKEMDALSKT